MPIPFLGAAAGLALRFPRAAKFVARFWKIGLGIAIAVGAYFAFTNWLGNQREAAFNSGFAKAEQQYQAAVAAANAQAAADQKALDLITQRFGFLAQTREQDIRIAVQPQLERITREVQNNPVYSQCLVTDGVRDDLNAAGATVNARIAASQP